MRTLSAVVREAQERLIDAKAAVSTSFFDRAIPEPSHIKIGLADRALRDAMQAMQDVLEALRGHDDGTQLPLLAV